MGRGCSEEEDWFQGRRFLLGMVGGLKSCGSLDDRGRAGKGGVDRGRQGRYGN